MIKRYFLQTQLKKIKFWTKTPRNYLSKRKPDFEFYGRGLGRVVTSPTGERPRVAVRRKSKALAATVRESGVWGKVTPGINTVFTDKFQI